MGVPSKPENTRNPPSISLQGSIQKHASLCGRSPSHSIEQELVILTSSYKMA